MTTEAQTADRTTADKEDPLAEIWSDDLLNRRQDAELLLTFLKNKSAQRSASPQGGSYVLNLDCEWGGGKTFFLKRFKQHAEHEGYLVAYISAWEDDHAADPMLAVMSAIDEVVNDRLRNAETATQENSKEASEAAKSAALQAWRKAWAYGRIITVELAKGGTKAFLKRCFDDAFDNIADQIKESKQGHSALGGERDDAKAKSAEAQNEAANDGSIIHEVGQAGSRALDKVTDQFFDDMLDSFRETKKASRSFGKNLKDFLDAMNDGKLDAEAGRAIRPPFFILLDELDRCRPTYAIELLERVKHLFDVPNVVFVVATDTGQLSHAIRAVYGAGFDGTRYLHRFFTRTYAFRSSNARGLLAYCIASHRIDVSNIWCPMITPKNQKQEPSRLSVDFLLELSDYFKLSLRELDRCIGLLADFQATWDLPTPQNPYPLDLAYLFPLIVNFYRGGVSKLDDVLNIPHSRSIGNKFSSDGVDLLGGRTRSKVRIEVYNSVDGLTVIDFSVFDLFRKARWFAAEEQDMSKKGIEYYRRFAEREREGLPPFLPGSSQMYRSRSLPLYPEHLKALGRFNQGDRD